MRKSHCGLAFDVVDARSDVEIISGRREEAPISLIACRRSASDELSAWKIYVFVRLLITSVQASAFCNLRSLRPILFDCIRLANRWAISAIAVVVMLAAITHTSGPAIAQAPTELSVPQRLYYLFELSWCSKWLFTCGITCKKIGDRIHCEEGAANCNPSFEHFECREFSVRESCLRWSDGCNTCSRFAGQYYCTAVGCRSYAPSFTCLQEVEK
jgi:hypothetical protein